MPMLFGHFAGLRALPDHEQTLGARVGELEAAGFAAVDDLGGAEHGWSPAFVLLVRPQVQSHPRAPTIRPLPEGPA